jgi:hypothetical protein
MTAPTVQYTSLEMIEAMKYATPSRTFLQEMLIKKSTNHATKWIEIDVVKGGQTLPAYVSRRADAEEVDRNDFGTKIHLIPYTNQKHTFTPEDLESRMPGNTIYENNPSSQINELVGNQLAELDKRIIRLEEKQLADAISNGTTVISGDGVSYTIDYGRDSGNSVALAGTAKWGGATDDIIANCEAANEQLSKPGVDGGVVTDIILGTTAASWFRKDTDILNYLDNRRVMVGEINPKYVASQDAAYIGTLNLPQLNADVWCYHGRYKNSAGAVTRYIDTNDAIFLDRTLRAEKHYSMIYNFKSGNFIGSRFPFMYNTEDGKRKILALESGPLNAVHQIDSTYRLKTQG